MGSVHNSPRPLGGGVDDGLQKRYSPICVTTPNFVARAGPNRLGVGIGFPKILWKAGATSLGYGDAADPLKHDTSHMLIYQISSLYMPFRHVPKIMETLWAWMAALRRKMLLPRVNTPNSVILGQTIRA